MSNAASLGKTGKLGIKIWSHWPSLLIALVVTLVGLILASVGLSQLSKAKAKKDKKEEASYTPGVVLSIFGTLGLAIGIGIMVYELRKPVNVSAALSSFL